MRPPHIPKPIIHPEALVLPGAQVHGRVEIGPRSVVMFGAVIRAELDRIVIGAETNVQDNAVFHCDEGEPTTVGDRVTVAHGAVVHGATVGDRALLGIGALALNGSIVGEGAWLGAGSVLPEDKEIPPWTLALGAPAKVVRELDEDEIRRAADGVDHYLEVAAAYRALVEEFPRPD